MQSNYANLERDELGCWTRKKRSYAKLKIALLFAVMGTFVYCSPAAWKYEQGLNHVDAEVIAAFQNGTCKHTGANTVSCSFVDKDTLKRWGDTMAAQVEVWKAKAGEPTAVLKRVCKDEDVVDADCPRVLYAMALRESSFGTNMVGDGGRSLGWFQILDIHKKVSKACKYDLECSARFSLRRMIEHGFNTNRDYAIMAHNGTPGIPATLTYLSDVKSKMKLFPN